MAATQPDAQKSCAHLPLYYLERLGLWDEKHAPGGWLKRHAPWIRRHAHHLAIAQAAYGVAVQVINIAQTWGKLALTAEYCVALLSILNAFVKIRCLLVNAVPIHETVDTLNAMRAMHAHENDVTHILTRTRAKSEKFARFMHSLCNNMIYIFLCGFVLAGLKKRSVPFRRWFPIDTKSSPIFELTMLVYAIFTYIDFYSILLFDLLFLSVLIEMIGEFRVLQHRLENIDLPVNVALKHLDNAALHEAAEKPDIVDKPQLQQQFGNLANRVQIQGADPRETKKPQHFVSVTANSVRKPWVGAWPTSRPTLSFEIHQPLKRRLGACIAHHQALFRLVELLETACQPALVIHLVCNICVGVTLVYVTLKSDHLSIMMINMVCTGIVCVGEFGLYCYFCTQLTTESARVGEALYACAWWDASPAFKSSQRIVLLRTNKPLFIRAAAIFPMSMETFASSDHLSIMMINMVCTGIVCVGEFGLYCYFCTQLTTESARVGEALYACAWWDASPAFKSSQRIVLLRTNKPLFIRAAAIFPMSMETFASVMNNAYNMYQMMITTN